MVKKIMFKMYKLLKYRNSIERFWKLRLKTLNSKGIKKSISKYKYRKIMKGYGALIPLTANIKSCPSFPHELNGIFISSGAKIGDGCVIFQQVTIGSNTLSDSKKSGFPVLGNNVYIGAGAKIIGGVNIGNNVRIGANCVVTKDIPDNATVVSAAPRIIEHSESRENNYTNNFEFQQNKM